MHASQQRQTFEGLHCHAWCRGSPRPAVLVASSVEDEVLLAVPSNTKIQDAYNYHHERAPLMLNAQAAG